MIEGQLPATRDCENPIERNVALGAKIGVNGTPTLIASDGRVKAGAGNIQEISAWLDQADKVSIRGLMEPLNRGVMEPVEGGIFVVLDG
jgi:hypothetical protein